MSVGAWGKGVHSWAMLLASMGVREVTAGTYCQDTGRNERRGRQAGRK
jgi:hypothetical protein